MSFGGDLQTGTMKAVHTGKHIEFLTEKSFETLFTFMTGIDLNTPILDHSQLILKLLRVGRITVHELLQPTNLS